MAIRHAPRRNAPRKTALAKAALRRSAAGAPTASGQSCALMGELVEALEKRPKVDFLDPFLRHAAMQAKGIGLCAFLVTLAAFQRGLKVTFNYERASFDTRFARSRMQGHRGEIFSLSDGLQTHTFSRSLGDLTDPAANAVAEDKHLTKMVLNRAGVRTPEGIVVDREQTSLVDKFVAQHSDKRFVVKPYDGSLSKDVLADVSSEVALCFLKEQPTGRFLVEEYIRGREYRALVVGNRCVAISLRDRPFVVGDGTSSIKSLIDAEHLILSRRNPFWGGFGDEARLRKFLARANFSFDDIAERGQRIFLSNTSECPYHVDVTPDPPLGLAQAAVSAAKVVGLVVAGVDLIVSDDGGICIIELNQRPHIGMHSFPYLGGGQGNAVAEAIVDHYFPKTIDWRARNMIAYDFAPVRTALESAQVSEITLPVVGRDWKVVRFHETGLAAKAIVKLIEAAARTAGVFILTAPHDKGGVELCLAYASPNFRSMLSMLPASFKRRLERLDSETQN